MPFALPAAIRAQTADLRILRYTPSDTGMPTSIIDVTFDRPVSGAPNRLHDAAKMMSVAPAVPGVFQWRDAFTVRFVPNAPYKPGTRVNVLLDTAALASGGARTGARHVLPVQFVGARPLAMMIDQRRANTDWASGPLPVFRVLYSTIVDPDSVAQKTRLVFPGSCGGTIALKVLRQRAVRAGEGNPIERAGGAGRDTVADRFRRVVELQPVDSLRPNCLGMWHVASFDPTRSSDAFYSGMRTAPPFSVTSLLPCLITSFAASRDCASDGLSIVFSAEVSTEEFMKHVHIQPDIPARSANVPFSTIFQLPSRLKAGVAYSVTIDSTMRDVFGRPLSGPLSYSVTAQDTSSINPPR
ncbi:MAG: hypothetical protein H7Z40_11850 [Phycisphaerae bacterium]|nr:hypothetical protein [Gemmatimonadaceae bacterium]